MKIQFDSNDVIERMQKTFLTFSTQTHGSPMYERLSQEIANDREMIEFLCQRQWEQPVPNLLLAAVNFLLHKNRQNELSDYYPNHGGTKSFRDDNLIRIFKKFCMDHSQDLLQLMQSRYVQTNEVRRCVLLRPAFARIVECGERQPMHLVDLGASSGLNLIFDRYHYSYSNGQQMGPEDAVLRLTCELKSNAKLPEILPEFLDRLGIDLNPIDLTNEDEVLWALSLIWPDQPERLQRLKSAIEVRKNVSLKMERGSGLSLLPLWSQSSADMRPLCLVHSYTVIQFSIEARQQLEEILLKISKKRPVWRVELEWFGTPFSELKLSYYANGEKKVHELLAETHAHGEWMDWKLK